MKKYIIPIIIILTSILLSIYFYPLLPENMASHWDANGIVNGYSSRITNILLFAILQILFLSLLFVIPKLDPYKENIKSFEKELHIFINALLIFTLILQLQVFLWNIGIEISMNIIMPILMGGLFLVIAYLLKNAKQNYTIGIRTPWTLHSKKVWNKTHSLGSKLFAISGILSILSILIPKYSFVVVIGSILAFTLYLFIYSYLEYQKEEKEKKKI